MRAAWAIAKKEFRGAFASPVAYAWLVVFVAFNAWFFFRGFFVLGLATMRGFFSLMPWTLVFLLPALTMRLWSEERKLGTLEVLLTWPVREREAVAGKFLGGLGLLAVSLAGTLPLALTVFALGDPDPGPVLAGYLGLLLFGGAGLAIGSYASALTENQIVAYIAGVALTFALFVAGASVYSPRSVRSQRANQRCATTPAATSTPARIAVCAIRFSRRSRRCAAIRSGSPRAGAR